MRHRASRPLQDLVHQLPRAAARPLGALARLSPARFVLSLVLMLGVGTGAFVAVASVGDGTSGEHAALDQRTGSTAPRSADRSDPTDPPSAAPGASERTGSPSGTPPARPSRTASSTGSDKSPAPDTTTAPPPGQDSSTPDPADPLDSSTGSASPAPQDATAPATTLSDRYPDGESAVFTFVADEPASFSCSLDGAAYEPCHSPTVYSDLEPGPHTFSVRAVDAAGNVEPTPAQVEWNANRGPAAESR